MIALYQFGNSVCCQKVRIVLAEKELSWTATEVHLFRNEQFDPAYLVLNPAGTVPTLVHDGAAVTESTLICEYLDASFPNPSLMPATPLGQAQARVWAKLVDEGLHEGVGAISFSAMFRERMQAMTPAERQIRYDNIGDLKRGDLFRQTFEHGAKAKQVTFAISAYDRMFRRLEAALTAGGPWIMGDAVTLADIALMPYDARLSYLGLLDLWIAERPAAQSWWTQVQAWPSFRAGITLPMIPREAEEMALHGPKIRPELAETLAETLAEINLGLPV